MLRLHQPRHHHPRLQRRHRRADHGHPPPAAHPRQTLPLEETHPLRRLLPRRLRHPLLHPVQVLLHLPALRHQMAAVVRPRGRHGSHSLQHPADMDALPPPLQLEVLPTTLVLQSQSEQVYQSAG